MQLVLYGAGTYCHVGKQVGKVSVVFRIEHLVGAGKARFLDRSDVGLSYGYDAFEHVLFHIGVRLMKEPLVALARSAGLVGVNAGHDKNLLRNLFLNGSEP